MGSEYDYTYILSKSFDSYLKQYLEKYDQRMKEIISSSKISYEQLNFAYYEGFKGNTWNKYAINMIIKNKSKSDIEYLELKKDGLKDFLQKSLDVSNSGFLIKDLDLLVDDNDSFEVDLPKEDYDYGILIEDINESLSRNEPVLVLDRLHTYTVKLLRELCRKHRLEIKDDHGKNHPIHSLMGMLVKYYKKKNILQSEFSIIALKSSISLFQQYNDIRNTKSFAHDNDVLNDTEAIYVIKIMVATLEFVSRVEKELS